MASTPRESRAQDHVHRDLPWGPLSLVEDEPVQRRFGPLTVHLLRTEGEIRIASQSHPADPGPSDRASRPPDDEMEAVEWSRWATPPSTNEVRFEPALPDRALVLEPELPFVLLPETEARVYVRVPMWVRIQLDLPDGAFTVQELPTVILSDTWWGDVLEGELSYWLHTSARRVIRPELLTEHQVVCPLHLTNRSDDELKVERLVLRVAHLSLFTGGESTGGFWADTSRVRYMGESEGSHIDMSGQPPEEAGGGRLVTPPRDPLPRGLRARTFARLKALPGMGGGP